MSKYCLNFLNFLFFAEGVRNVEKKNNHPIKEKKKKSQVIKNNIGGDY